MPQVLVSRTSGETSRPIPPAQIRLLWVDSPGYFDQETLTEGLGRSWQTYGPGLAGWQ